MPCGTDALKALRESYYVVSRNSSGSKNCGLRVSMDQTISWVVMRTIPLLMRFILVLGLALAATSCESRGQRRAGIAGGVVGAAVVGGATHSWAGAAVGAAGGAVIGSRIHHRRAHTGRPTLFH